MRLTPVAVPHCTLFDKGNFPPSEAVMKMISALLFAALLTGIGCGYGSTANTPAMAGAMPAIAQLAPNSAPAGSGGLTLTVNGSNFSPNAVVNFNSTALTTSYVTGNQLTAAVPNSALATAADWAVP